MEIRKAGDYQVVIFPEMVNPAQTKISFYATRHLAEPATFAIGVMSDANDVESFQPLDTITIATMTKANYLSFAYDLSQYKFDGRFFAIKSAYDYTNAWSHLWVDDVRFYENSSCGEPFELKSEVNGDRATISWKNNGASSWNVFNLYSCLNSLSKYGIKDVSISDLIKDNIVALAVSEHARWNMEKFILGFHPYTTEQIYNDINLSSQERNAERKRLKKKESTHINLCSYQQLMRIDRENFKYDCFLILAMDKIIKKANK